MEAICPASVPLLIDEVELMVEILTVPPVPVLPDLAWNVQAPLVPAELMREAPLRVREPPAPVPAPFAASVPPVMSSVPVPASKRTEPPLPFNVNTGTDTLPRLVIFMPPVPLLI